MSFRAIILFAVIASALGFAPLSTRASRTSISMAMQDLPGITGPLGFFDPLGNNTYNY